ncbi:transcriptional regulator, TetR family [Duganella sp. CF517]|uniref:TetR/AcrR family transcriptional regulator n=1 Tax=Duganella sp. CF517 TaxID=1881038 RepID=UPI0008BCF63B|nr:TetR/AcrR family transcriptional regulator [Duganella sp. CF517]SEO08489.1 transcriptional regulator, TetR family [Duganella sp. CF517]
MQDQADLLPRKLPRQARSRVTVDAILQATTEMLKRNDFGGAITTRVALRAGVSVGTLYQYFPHQEALRFAALQRHLDGLAAALEELCARHRRKPLATLARDFATGYVDLKLARVADRQALQHHMADLGMEREKSAVFARTELALGELLLSAPDAGFADPRQTATALLAEMHAAVWPALARAGEPARITGLRDDMVGLVGEYLGARRPPGRDSFEMRIA